MAAMPTKTGVKHALISLLVGLSIGSAVSQVESTISVLPTDPGMYVQSGDGFTKIIGQIAQFTRTGSRLVSHATVGIKAAKANIQLPGPHAQTLVSAQPVFYFIPPKQEAAAGVNAGDFILIRLEEKPQRRQFEVSAAGLFRASSGISLTHQVQILRSEPNPGVYMITPATELNRGEYAFYLARGEGMAAYVYDFGVQGTHSEQTLKVGTQRRTANVSEVPSRITADMSNKSSYSPGVGPTAAAGQSPKPAVDKQSADAMSVITSASGQVTVTKSQGAALGVTGSDWEQDGVKGVEIVVVSDNSSAQLAGLRKGYVITEVNGVHVRSTQELSNILARLGPGSRVSIGYLYKSNLGWMPKETVAILSK